MYEFVQITIPRTGLFKLTGMMNVLKKYLRAKRFEELKIPLVVTATSLSEGNRYISGKAVFTKRSLHPPPSCIV